MLSLDVQRKVLQMTVLSPLCKSYPPALSYQRAFIKKFLQKVSQIKCLYIMAWARGYKTFFMLNYVEHEILKAHKYKNIKKFSFFQTQISRECYFPTHKC